MHESSSKIALAGRMCLRCRVPSPNESQRSLRIIRPFGVNVFFKEIIFLFFLKCLRLPLLFDYPLIFTRGW